MIINYSYTRLFRGIVLFFSLCFSLSIVNTLTAQTINYIISAHTGNVVGTLVRPQSDSSSIIAGYIYNNLSSPTVWDSDVDIADADMILFKVKNGNILWAKRWGTDGVNDFIQDVTIAANGDIIAVTAEGVPTIVNGSLCGIYRFDANGNLLYQNRVSFQNSSNSYFQGVCELANGNIVAVGTENTSTYDIYNRKGFVVTYASHLTYMRMIF